MLVGCYRVIVETKWKLDMLRTIEHFEDSNYQEISTVSTSRPFGEALSGENIKQAIQSAIPDSTKKDT